MHQFVEPKTPREEPITSMIREAIINHPNREDQYNEIRANLFVSRNKAKEMFYAFMWRADEDFLTNQMMEDY